MANTIKKIMKQKLGRSIEIIINNKASTRNYKVILKKSKKYLKFIPQENLESIISEIILKSRKIIDFNNDCYYNINTFKRIKSSTKIKL